MISLLRRLSVSREQVNELRNLLQDELPLLSKQDDGQSLLSLPEEYHPLYQPDTSVEYRHAMAYVKRRGITPYDIVRYQIGYCKSGLFRNRIVIPSYTSDGILNYFIGRTFQDYGLNYLTPTVSKNIIGLEDQINWKHPIVIVEGIFDAIAVKRNAIPLFGKQISKKLRQELIEKNVRDVYLALDDDALKDTIRHAEKLMNEGLNVYVVELSGKDPSQLGFIETQRLIKSAKKLTFMDLMNLKLRLS